MAEIQFGSLILQKTSEEVSKMREGDIALLGVKIVPGRIEINIDGELWAEGELCVKDEEPALKITRLL